MLVVLVCWPDLSEVRNKYPPPLHPKDFEIFARSRRSRGGVLILYFSGIFQHSVGRYLQISIIWSSPGNQISADICLVLTDQVSAGRRRAACGQCCAPNCVLCDANAHAPPAAHTRNAGGKADHHPHGTGQQTTEQHES